MFEVQVINGGEKGKQGVVQKVVRKKNELYVEGVNLTRYLQPPDGERKRSQVASREGPIHVSNVALLDPDDGRPCRVGFRFQEDGTKVRVSKRSGKVIPKPAVLRERTRERPPPGAKDTLGEVALRVTYGQEKLSAVVMKEMWEKRLAQARERKLLEREELLLLMKKHKKKENEEQPVGDV